jgi:hypothetical protein
MIVGRVGRIFEVSLEADYENAVNVGILISTPERKHHIFYTKPHATKCRHDDKASCSDF